MVSNKSNIQTTFPTEVVLVNIKKNTVSEQKGSKLLNVRMGKGIFFNLPEGIPYTLNIKLIIGHFPKRN